MVLTEKLTLISEGGFYAINITERVRSVVKSSGIREGSVLVFYRHTTGAVIIVEHEAGILVDLEDVLERIVPIAYDYKHHLRGFDTNGAAHIRTALLSVSATVPVVDGDLLIGKYQEILVVDMEPTKGSPRTVIVQVMGE
jgi:secondary thiamine-phosphate synthase enzyme